VQSSWGEGRSRWGTPTRTSANYEFQAPIFVLTHHPPGVAPKQDEHLTFTFVTVLRGGTAIQATAIAAGVALIMWRLLIRQVFSTTLGFVILFLIFVGISVAVYVLWYWFLFEHPAELAAKLPMSSKEQRRKKKSSSTDCQSDLRLS
jgi:hypothetical protein